MSQLLTEVNVCWRTWFCLKKKNMTVYLFLLSSAVLQGSFCKNIYLTPTQASVELNNNLTLTCTYNNYGEVLGTKWNIGGKYTPSIVRNQNGTCTGSGIFADETIYTVGCPSKTSFNVTMLQVQLGDHNVTWECFDRERNSNNVTVFVNVPVRSVVLSGPNTSLIKEHSRQTIKCKTSTGRPQPNISWFIWGSAYILKHKITVNSSSQVISSTLDGFVAVESTLLFYPNRSINKWTLNCEAWIDNKSLAVQSNTLLLNISYPPDGPPIILGHKEGNEYKLIESEEGELSCFVSSGNPLPRLKWKCYNSQAASTLIDGSTIINNVTWIGSRNQTSCTCASYHSWSKTTQSTNVSIDILFPPQRPMLKIGTTNVIDIIYVIINNTLNITCESKGNPLPKYSWTGPYIPVEEDKELNVTIDDKNDRIYKCKAINKMTRSDGTQKLAENETVLTVKVLYPPNKPYFRYGHIHGELISHNILEVHKGDSFSIYCDSVGNPVPSLLWENSNTNRSFINIQSIKSALDKTCTATNNMEETVGERQIGFSKSTLHIKVFTPSKVLVFNATANNTNGAFIVNEKDEVSFSCMAEGYPASEMVLLNPDGNTILNKSNSNRIRQVLRNVSHDDAGKYTCVGNNVITKNQSSQADLILIVRCPPRPSTSGHNTIQVIARLNTDIKLQFKAQEYLDEPDNTHFTWFFHHQSVHSDGSKFKISTKGEHSELLIRNVTHKDVGQIAVHVSNSVGNYIHFYELLIKGKPDKPLYFNIVDNSITDSSVTLTWTAGFNGGENQTFILLYKVSSHDIWNNKTVVYDGRQHINFTLIGLEKMTEYDVKIISRNAIGDSDPSHNFHFKTKSKDQKVLSDINETNMVVFIGVGVGTFTGTMIVVAVFLICYRLVRKNQSSVQQTPGNTNACHSTLAYDNLDSRQSDGNVKYKNYDTVIYEDIETPLQDFGTIRGSASSTKSQDQR